MMGLSTKARIGVIAAAVTAVAGLGAQNVMSQSGFTDNFPTIQPSITQTLKTESASEPEQSTSPILPPVHTSPRTPIEPDTTPVVQSPEGYPTSTADPAPLALDEQEPSATGSNPSNPDDDTTTSPDPGPIDCGSEQPPVGN